LETFREELGGVESIQAMPRGVEGVQARKISLEGVQRDIEAFRA
jgi:hypothetical protein